MSLDDDEARMQDAVDGLLTALEGRYGSPDVFVTAEVDVTGTWTLWWGTEGQFRASRCVSNRHLPTALTWAGLHASRPPKVVDLDPLLPE